MLAIGSGVDVDHDRALKHLRRAAALGDPRGHYGLAAYLSAGQYVEQDRPGAAAHAYAAARLANTMCGYTEVLFACLDDVEAIEAAARGVEILRGLGYQDTDVPGPLRELAGTE